MSRVSSCCKAGFFWRPVYDRGKKLVSFCKRCEKQCRVLTTT